MKMKILAIFMAVALCCLGYGVPSFAGQQLDEINAKVERQSMEIDQKHGVLLDYQERNDLKLDLIAKQALMDAGKDTTKTTKEIAETAFTTYEVTDLSEQRKLIIKIEAQKSIGGGTGGGGQGPEYP